jgi:hypothetical protein
LAIIDIPTYHPDRTRARIRGASHHRILPFQMFMASDERFQHYAEKHAGSPSCTTYIDRKLALLRKKFSGLLRSAA